MIQKVKYWFDGLFKPNRVVSVHVQLDKSLNSKLSFIILKKKKDDVEQEGELEELDSLTNLKLNNTPIVLSVSGAPILTKSVEIEVQGEAIKSAFPQIKRSDFIVQEQNIGSRNWISLIRKDQFNTIINTLEIPEKNIVSIRLGVQCFLPFIDAKSEIAGYSLKFENNMLSEIALDESSSLDSTLVSGNKIDSKVQFHFLTGTSFLLGIVEPISDLSIDLTNRASKFIEDRLIRFIGIGTICVGFLLAIGNFVWFNSVNAEWNEISSRKMQMESEMREFNRNLEAQQRQAVLFEKLNIKQFTHHSEIVDKLAPFVSKKIRLTSVELEPEIKSKKIGEPISFDRNVIEIEGEAIDGHSFEDFTQDIKGSDIFKNVLITEYTKDALTRKYYFSLKASVIEI